MENLNENKNIGQTSNDVFGSRDDELLKFAKEKGRFDLLIEKYKPLVLSRARTYSFVVGDVEDLIQEGMIGLYEAIQGYKNTHGASFKTFAYLCIDRQIKSAIKKANNNNNKLLDDYVPYDYITADNAGGTAKNPEELLIDKENVKKIINDMKRLLSKNEYEILKLYLKGDSYVEIHKKLDVDVKTVDNALYRTREKLKKFKEKK